MLALLSAPSAMASQKKDKKYTKQQVETVKPVAVQPKEETVTITNASKQLYGDWAIESVRKKNLGVNTLAHIYLDFNGNKFYGNNSCNTINGKFTISGNNITFKDIIATQENCKDNNNTDRNIMKAFAEVQHFQVTRLYNVERLQLTNGKGTVLMVLKRQNFDFLNGAWVVKEAEQENVLDKNVRIVIDVNMQTIHGNTGCNIINGVIALDQKKDFAIQFEDLHSSNNKCENIGVETDVLLALEQTESYKKINEEQIALLDHDGKIIMVLNRLKMR